MIVASPAARTQKRCMELFFYKWMVLYFAGSASGLLAGRAALLANETALSSFCSKLYADYAVVFGPLFGASACFLLLTVLLSQLPGGRFLPLFLVPVKAFSTAYVFSIFYLLREQTAISAAVAAVALHAVFFLPAFYFLCVHCSRGSLAGRGPFWLRYRILPILLTFVYLFLATLLERYLLGRLF